jgi:chromosome condensin MukBEF ATPase and DNA-binding subunit MukB
MSKEIVIPKETVISKIYEIRGKKVMLDKELAELYGVTTGNLNKAVSRNLKRFPEDFMFQLTEDEWGNLKSQIETSSWGGTRKMPKAFTEQGVAMLSGVLNSDRAIMVNIQIMRAYTKMRELLLTHKDLLLKMEELEKRVAGQDEKVVMIFNYLKQFIKEQETPRKRIGFKTEKE